MPDQIVAYPGFLSGTLIRMSDGTDKDIVNIEAHDRVASFTGEHGKRTRINAVSRQHVLVQPDLPVEQAGYPIRILRGALADGSPNRDLLVTPEQTLLVKGVTIPASHLVNSQNIFFDRSIVEYDCHYLGIKRNAVLLANGALCENHQLSARGPSTPRHARSITSHKAKLLFDYIAERDSPQELAKTLDPDASTRYLNLRLITDTGRELHKLQKTDCFTVFMLPERIRTVHLLPAAPTDINTAGFPQAPTAKSTLLIGRVALWGSRKIHMLVPHLVSPSLAGWGQFESTPSRWTHGDALIPLHDYSSETPRALGIEVLAVSPPALHCKLR